MHLRRRDFHMALSALLAGCALDPDEAATASEASSPQRTADGAGEAKPLQIGMLLFPDLTALDFVGPQLIFATMGDVRVHLLWKDLGVVPSDSGLGIQATTRLSDCPKHLDILFVPGGGGTARAMRDPELLAFLADRGACARYVTSVCTGTLLLGAAGLLCGYRAATHWAYRDVLSLLGATPVAERVVRDRNRITGGGVTAGIDFALTVSAQLRGETGAQRQELVFEYAPQPPFHTGTPELAGPELTNQVRARIAPRVEAARAAALEIARCPA